MAPNEFSSDNHPPLVDKFGTTINVGDTLYNPRDRDMYHKVISDGSGRLYLGDLDSPLARYAPQEWWEVVKMGDEVNDGIPDLRRTLRGLKDAIPAGSHDAPKCEWVNVRLDFVQAAIEHLNGTVDQIDWLDKGIREWRDLSNTNSIASKTATARANVAIHFLQEVLSMSSQHTTHPTAIAANNWLISIEDSL